MRSLNSLTVMAPAKLNLSLDITAKRQDGYHELETVMQSIDICDRVTVSLVIGNGGAISLRCPNFPELEGASNIACKAAEAFFKATKISGIGADILLRKNIPFGAGMGGGSADGAAVLFALDILCNTSLSKEKLCEIGLTIGADVPFCIMGGTMLAKGIGERLTPLAPFPEAFFVVVKPPISISTVQAYQAVDAGKIQNRPNTQRLCKEIENGDIAAISAEFLNVFEQATERMEIERAKAALIGYGALNPTMTGSGSAVFGIFAERDKAEECYFALSSENIGGVYICVPVNSGAWLCNEIDELFEE